MSRINSNGNGRDERNKTMVVMTESMIPSMTPVISGTPILLKFAKMVLCK